jgi:hypothetical protein
MKPVPQQREDQARPVADASRDRDQDRCLGEFEWLDDVNWLDEMYPEEKVEQGCARPTATSSDQMRCHAPMSAPTARAALLGLMLVIGCFLPGSKGLIKSFLVQGLDTAQPGFTAAVGSTQQEAHVPHQVGNG